MGTNDADYIKKIFALGKAGDWTLKEVLGAGAFNIVIAAERRAVDGSRLRAAVKIAKPKPDNSGYADTFVHEFKTLQKIDSPYIPKVLDSGIIPASEVRLSQDIPWFAIEQIKADTLEEEIEKHGILHKQEWLELAHDLLCAVAATHEAGIIHLDIKPDQIMRHSRRSILVDYGNSTTAHVMDEGAIGISHYMYASPEQMNPGFDKEDLGYESDIFNVGSTLVYAATGVPPWDPPNRNQSIRNFKGDLFTRMTTILPRTKGLDEDQLRIVDLMLQTNPQHRISAADAIDLIRELLPTGSSRKTGDYKFESIRSVPQKLTINQRLDKTIAKQKAALAVEEAKKLLKQEQAAAQASAQQVASTFAQTNAANDVAAATEHANPTETPSLPQPAATFPTVAPAKPPKDKKATRANAVDVLMNRGDNWWTDTRITIWLVLTGPIGTGIRFYYLEGKQSSKTFGQLERNLAALFFGLWTFGFAVPFIAFERYRRNRAPLQLKLGLADLAMWVTMIACVSIASGLEEGTFLFSALGFVAFFASIVSVVLTAVIPFNMGPIKAPKEKKSKETLPTEKMSEG